MTQNQKRKHVPQRTCVGCRTVYSKRAMTRVVRTAEGVSIDWSGKLAGRGAYLHNSRTCWKNGLKSALARALKTKISPEDLERLAEYANSLPPE